MGPKECEATHAEKPDDEWRGGRSFQPSMPADVVGSLFNYCQP
jgi:hypothetical protein